MQEEWCLVLSSWASSEVVGVWDVFLLLRVDTKFGLGWEDTGIVDEWVSKERSDEVARKLSNQIELVLRNRTVPYSIVRDCRAGVSCSGTMQCKRVVRKNWRTSSLSLFNEPNDKFKSSVCQMYLTPRIALLCTVPSYSGLVIYLHVRPAYSLTTGPRKRSMPTRMIGWKEKYWSYIILSSRLTCKIVFGCSTPPFHLFVRRGGRPLQVRFLVIL